MLERSTSCFCCMKVASHWAAAAGDANEKMDKSVLSSSVCNQRSMRLVLFYELVFLFLDVVLSTSSHIRPSSAHSVPTVASWFFCDLMEYSVETGTSFQ